LRQLFRKLQILQTNFIRTKFEIAATRGNQNLRAEFKNELGMQDKLRVIPITIEGETTFRSSTFWWVQNDPSQKVSDNHSRFFALGQHQLQRDHDNTDSIPVFSVL
jgi:hypothetical protein